MPRLMGRRSSVTAYPPVAYPPATVFSPRQRLRNRIGVTAYVTAVECTGLYAWLRLSRKWRDKLGAVSLVLEETLESGLLVVIFVRGPQDKALMNDPGVDAHLQKAQTAAALAINAEILIWLLWLSLAETVPPQLAGTFLLVTMHLKHQLEAATVMGRPFWSQFRSPNVVIGSLSEVIGGVRCLQHMRANRRLRAAAWLYGGIGFEHALFINAVQSEMEQRDICLPRAN
jgi:hypothetical protein